MTYLRERGDLEQKIAEIQSRFSGELGFAFKNISTGEEFRVNADHVFPTASAIKIAVLVEIFTQLEQGKLSLEDRSEMAVTDLVGGSGILKELTPGLQPCVKDLATLMVVLSDNTATNMLIDMLGGVEAVNRRLQDEYRLKSVVLHNRVDFEKIGDDVRRFAEATPANMMRLMELMVGGELVSPKASRQMRKILGRQQYLDQVPRYLNFNPYAEELKIDQDISCICKTGFFPGTRVDTGAIFLPGDIPIAYSATAHNSSDVSMSIENEPAVINGLLGRLMVEYWWPRDDISSASIPTCYTKSLGL